MKRTILFSFAAAILLSGCVKEHGPVETGQSEVKFTGNVARILTRVGGDDGTQWHTDDPVGIYMFKGEGSLSAEHILSHNKHHKATAGASAAFAPGDGTPLLYPADGSGVKFVAYHPHSAAVTTDFKVPVNVATQTNLTDIDVLYAPETAAFSKSSTSAVPLQFAHKLTKLVFNVSNGTGVTEPVANGIEVAISGQKTAGSLDLVTGNVASSGATASITASGAATIEAIVLPSDNLAGVGFTFTNKAGQTFVVAVPTTRWEGGKQYTYTVTLNPADKSSEISGSITPWGNGGTEAIAGNETIETGAGAGRRSIAFTADEPWTASVEDAGNTRAGGSNVSWLKLTRGGTETYEGGAGTVILDAEIDANDSGEARSARITVGWGATRTTWIVSQSASIDLAETVQISLAGTGEATIDWGDGQTETCTLTSPAISVEHTYVDRVEHIITVLGRVNYTMIGGNNSNPLGMYLPDLVSDHPWLLYANSSGDQIVTLDADYNRSLADLLFKNSPVKDVDLSGNPSLAVLCFVEKAFTSLDVSDCQSLLVLMCHDTGLSSLKLDGCSSLKWLSCGGNKFTELNLSGNRTIEVLLGGGDYDPLTTIDVSGCTSLRDLTYGGGYENQLSHLNVEGCTSLHTLHCTSTKITQLDLSTNSALVNLDCSANELTSLDLSNQPNLFALNLRHNSIDAQNMEMLFRTLHDRTGQWNDIDMDLKWIDIYDNPGYEDINTDDAVAKGWEVRTVW